MRYTLLTTGIVFPTTILALTCPSIPSPFPNITTLTSNPALPDPFTYLSGGRVTTKEEWQSCRQPEIVSLLQHYQYGSLPPRERETVTGVRAGKSIQVNIGVGDKNAAFWASMVLPANASSIAKVPAVISTGGDINTAPFLAQGVAVVSFGWKDVSDDSSDKSKGAFWDLYPGTDVGVLTAWAWAYSRVLDALASEADEIDTTRIGVMGCSQFGKAALAAGLFDSRISLTMPMSSGIMGLSPYRFGNMSPGAATLEGIKAASPWWANSELAAFADSADKLPFDAHFIAAAIAPRALVMDQGTADPNSMAVAEAVFPAAKAVYDFLGAGNMLADGSGNGLSKIGMAMRSGGSCDDSGFTNVLPFVKQVFFGTNPGRNYTDLAPLTGYSSAYPWIKDIPGIVGAYPSPTSTPAPPPPVTATSLSTTFTPTTIPATVTGSTPPGPTQAGIVATCNKFAEADGGVGCEAFAKANGITPEQLYSWNAVLGAKGEFCMTQFFAKDWYCIGVSTTPLPPAPVTTATGTSATSSAPASSSSSSATSKPGTTMTSSMAGYSNYGSYLSYKREAVFDENLDGLKSRVTGRPTAKVWELRSPEQTTMSTVTYR